MRFLKPLFNFYINSSIHVALAVYALTWISLIELGLTYQEPVLYFVFYATITGYNFVKYFDVSNFSIQTISKSSLKAISFLSLLTFFLMCYYGSQLGILTISFVFIFALVTFLYAFPVSNKKMKTLRNIEGLKIYIIAFVWTGVTVFIPVLKNNYSIELDVVLMSIQRFLYVLILMLPFEIRDLRLDDKQLATIPQRFGVKKTKFFGFFITMIFFVLEFFKHHNSESTTFVLGLLSLVTLFFLLFSRANQSKYYCSFWVEALPIFWLCILIYFL